MSKALSVDLRSRVVAAVKAGASHREAAARFGVSAASVSRWRCLEREQGDVRPGPLGGDRRSGRVEAQADLTCPFSKRRRTSRSRSCALCWPNVVTPSATLQSTGSSSGTPSRVKKDRARA